MVTGWLCQRDRAKRPVHGGRSRREIEPHGSLNAILNVKTRLASQP